MTTATQDANFAFTMYFVVEMAVKLMGLGPHRYVSDNFNIFDGLVTMLGVLDMALTLAPGVDSPGAMSVFRAFRLLRVGRVEAEHVPVVLDGRAAAGRERRLAPGFRLRRPLRQTGRRSARRPDPGRAARDRRRPARRSPPRSTPCTGSAPT